MRNYLRHLTTTTAVFVLVIATASPGLAIETDQPTERSEARRVETVERTAPAEPGGGQQSTLSNATCQGCYAWASIAKNNSWPGVNVRAKTRNYASETIDKQEAHLALVAGTACYDGDYKYQGGTGNQYNREDGSIVDSGWKYGGHGWWTNANGHNWWDDGGHWAVNGSADICRQY